MNVHPRFVCNELTSVDWARLAAYIDSEGCISIGRMVNKSRRGTPEKTWTGYGLQVHIVNTDIRLNVWLGRFGAPAIYKTRKAPGGGFANARPQHIWSVRGWGAYYILTNCLPYFVLKLDQAETAIAFQESKRPWGRGTKIPDAIKAEWQAAYLRLRQLKTPPTEWKEIVQ